MKQTLIPWERTWLNLRDHMEADDGWGVQQGKKVNARLVDAVEKHPNTTVFCISLRGVKRTDASFPRESVMELAHRFRGSHSFCLWHLEDSDLRENWDDAAIRRKQPMLSWNDTRSDLLGPKLSAGLVGVFKMLALATCNTALGEVPQTTAAQVATKLGLSVPNASNKLKSLWKDDYIVRREQVAPSGGIEFHYFVAR